MTKIEETLKHFAEVVPDYFHQFKIGRRVREFEYIDKIKSQLMLEIIKLSGEIEVKSENKDFVDFVEKLRASVGRSKKPNEKELLALKDEFSKQSESPTVFILNYLFTKIEPHIFDVREREILRKVKEIKKSLTGEERDLLKEIKQKTHLTKKEKILFDRFENKKAELKLTQYEADRLKKIQSHPLTTDEQLFLKNTVTDTSPHEQRPHFMRRLLILNQGTTEKEKKLLQRVQDLKEKYFNPKEISCLNKIENLRSTILTLEDEKLLKKIEVLKRNKLKENGLRDLDDIKVKKKLIKKINFYLKTLFLKDDHSFQAACTFVNMHTARALQKLKGKEELGQQVPYFDKHSMYLRGKVNVVLESFEGDYLKKQLFNKHAKLDFLKEVIKKVCEGTDEKLKPSVEKIMNQVLQLTESQIKKFKLNMEKVEILGRSQKTMEVKKEILPIIEMEKARHLKKFEIEIARTVLQSPLSGPEQVKVLEVSKKFIEKLRNEKTSLTKQFGNSLAKQATFKSFLAYLLTEIVPEKTGSHIERSLKKTTASDSKVIAEMRKINLNEAHSRSAGELSQKGSLEILDTTRIQTFLGTWQKRVGRRVAKKVVVTHPDDFESLREEKPHFRPTSHHLAEAFKVKLASVLNEKMLEESLVESLIDPIAFHVQIELWRTKTACRRREISDWQGQFKKRFKTAIKQSELVSPDVMTDSQYEKLKLALDVFLLRLLNNKFVAEYVSGELVEVSPRIETIQEEVKVPSIVSKKELDLKSAGG